MEFYVVSAQSVLEHHTSDNLQSSLMIEQLFFQLIRVAIGSSKNLSHTPSAHNWGELYRMAKKQSLVGICFAGVQKLVDSEKEDYFGMTELQYLTWMGMAAKIQQRNEVVIKQCVGLQKLLVADGLRSSILKGQGVALYYGEHLRYLRQSGDIDAWLDAPRVGVVEWARAYGTTNGDGDLHVECKLFEDTSVELHFTPSIASGSKTNKRLQEWFESRKDECMTNKVGTFTTPTTEFNAVYLLHHIFRHYLYEGIGLRQMLDYYFVLRTFIETKTLKTVSPLQTIKELGMEKFAGAVMYVMREVFGMDEKSMICPVDEKRGRRLLEVIMEGGNFGHSTEKYKITGWDKPWSRLSRYVRRNWFLLWDYPDEILSNVLGIIKS